MFGLTMLTGNSFRKTLDILHREMDVSLYRRDVIANNIANADTPHFKRSVVNFESALKAALDSEKPSRHLQPFLSDKRHIPFDRPVDYRTVRPRRVLDFLTTAKNNGNNVDIEQETMNALHNQLQYQLMSQVVASYYNQVNLVVR
ncbi:MAG: flagellar basal body rod protein FlgB [Spirochaetales bacterium]